MLVCFDYDGVIVDSLARVIRMAREAQASLGLGRAPTEEDLRSLENLTFVDFALRIGIPRSSLPAFGSILLGLQRREDSPPPLFPGMREVLREIGGRCPMAVITASITAEVQKVLKAHALLDCFSMLLDGQDPRPKSEKLNPARAHFGAEPQETYMVGDARSDIQQGKQAGVRTVAVTWGYQSRETLRAEQPDFLIDSPSELLTILSPSQGDLSL